MYGSHLHGTEYVSNAYRSMFAVHKQHFILSLTYHSSACIWQLYCTAAGKHLCWLSIRLCSCSSVSCFYWLDRRPESSIFAIPSVYRALVQFYFECGFESLGEVFIQLCSTNANNQQCYNLIGTLGTDAARVQSSCPTGGSSCSSSCWSSIQTFCNNAGCCVNVFKTSALTELIAADDNHLWVSCSVETPGFCTQSSVSHPSGGTNTHYPLSKLLVAFGSDGIHFLKNSPIYKYCIIVQTVGI